MMNAMRRATATSKTIKFKTDSGNKKRNTALLPTDEKNHRTFKDMIQWRKEREQKERTVRNKKLMETLKNDINPRFQLADIRAFTLPSSNGLSGTGASTWTGLGLIPDLVRGVEAGLKLPKPLASQSSGIPAVMNIKTGLFAAPTGCGKTLTYLLPLFQHLKNDEKVKIGAIGDSNTKTDAKIITDTNDSNTNTEINTDTNDSNTNTEINTDTNDSNINTKIETKDSNTEINTDINDSDTNTKTDTKTKMDTSNVSLKSSISIGPRALILVPTHELVRQVYATAKTLSHYAKLRVETIDTVFKHGKTQGAVDQIDILISTPRSLLRNRIEAPIKIKTGAISRVIIDEADTLFSADFALDMKQILMQSGLPRENLQVLATSATITKQLQRTMQTLFPQTSIHMTPGLHATLPALRQRFLTIHQPGNAKMQETLKFVLEQPTSRILVFCNKLVKAESLHKYLCEKLVDSTTTTSTTTTTSATTDNLLVQTLPAIFHGNLPPVQRASIIEKFASGAIRVLICTDLAARGLDTPWVNHVINFDFPRSLQDYLHRAGRTARAGRGGAVTSFVTGKDRALYEYIELAAKQRRILSDPLPQ